MAWECNSVIEHFLSLCETLGLIPNAVKRKKKTYMDFIPHNEIIQCIINMHNYVMLTKKFKNI